MINCLFLCGFMNSFRKRLHFRRHGRQSHFSGSCIFCDYLIKLGFKYDNICLWMDCFNKKNANMPIYVLNQVYVFSLNKV